MQVLEPPEDDHLVPDSVAIAPPLPEDGLEEFGFHFGTIKRLAKPGGWRRGYGYFRGGHVQALELTETGVCATVKGSYRESYFVQLTFTPRSVTPECDCPLSEPWCKHAVAVGLATADSHLWESYFGIPLPDDWAALQQPQGQYVVLFHAALRPKTVGLRFIERRTGKAVTNLEATLRAAIALQTEQPGAFNEMERREFNLMQLPMKHGQLRSKDGWFGLPQSEADVVLKALTTIEDPRTPEGERLLFEPDPLTLELSVNVSMAGNVLVSLHWVHQPEGLPSEAANVFPMEEIYTFAKDIPWGLRRNRVYPLAHLLSKLPAHLTRGTFTDIRDADGGKFMYEELPRLRRIVNVEESPLLEQLKLERKPPHKVLSVSLVDAVSLRVRASLAFTYDGVTVPFSRSTPDTPYVMVVQKSKELIYWVRRDAKAEQAAYQALAAGGLEPMQTNFFNAEGDDAIDFVSQTMPNLGDEWTVHCEDDLSILKTADSPLRIRAGIDFDASVDHFVARIDCVVGHMPLDLDTVQNHLIQGKKYFLLPGAGYVEIPLASILQFGRTLQAFDAETLDQDVYRIQTYKAGLIAELVEQGVQLALSPRFQKFWDRVTAFNTLESVPVPENVHAELRPYQKQGFNWLWFLYCYGLNGILADDMGLGKTLQTLVLLQAARNADLYPEGVDDILLSREEPRPSLIVCPTSVVYNWENEIRRFTPDLEVLNLTGSNRFGHFKKIPEADIVLTNYALLRRDITALKNYPFRYIILDESQNIKNMASQTAQASKQLQANHRLALSGTPIENRLTELWSVFDFLMPGFLYDPDEFRYRYVTPIEEKGNHDAASRLKKQVSPFILRRLKQDVAKDLPPKVETVLSCDMTEAQQALYLKILEEAREQVFASPDTDKRAVFTSLLRLRQVCCHPSLMGAEADGVKESGKFEALQEMIQEIINEGGRILLFSQFVEMLKLVQPWLQRKGIKYEMLTGETPASQRGEAVSRFNRDSSIPIFLISLKAGGTGLNLTGADYVIHYDPWWNPAAEDQATDRAHRIGQTKTVFVYRLITRGTVEEKIQKLQSKKRDLVDAIISADKDLGKFLSFEDLKDILTPSF